MSDDDTTQQEETVTRVSRSPDQVQEATIRTRSDVSSPGSQVGKVIWLAAGVVDAALALDFVFKLIAASSVGFVAAIGSFTGALNAPFRGVFATTLTTGAHVAYWPDVVAIVVYTLAAWILVSLIGIVTAPRKRSSTTV
jgi:hypothetical protein